MASGIPSLFLHTLNKSFQKSYLNHKDDWYFAPCGVYLSKSKHLSICLLLFVRYSCRLPVYCVSKFTITVGGYCNTVPHLLTLIKLHVHWILKQISHYFVVKVTYNIINATRTQLTYLYYLFTCFQLWHKRKWTPFNSN